MKTLTPEQYEALNQEADDFLNTHFDDFQWEAEQEQSDYETDTDY